MADDLNDTPNDSIASALASALAQHEKGAEAPAETQAKESKDAVRNAVADDAMGGANQRDAAASDAASGDTASAAGEGEETEAAAGESEDASDKSGEKTGAAEKPAGTEPPANWSAKDKETFKALAPDAQKFLLDRHKAMEGDYIKKTQAIANFKREYEPVDKIFEPYRDRMKAAGWTPAKLVEAWGNVEKRLMEGDGVNVVAGLIQGYKIDMGQVARALGFQPRPRQNGAATEQPGEPEHQQDTSLPSDHPLMRQLMTIQQRLDADDRARADAARRQQTAAETRIMTEIEEFKSALDDKGNLAHPHFDELEDIMTHLAQSALAAKKPIPPIKDLYETAVWANPSTRDATLAARERAQQAQAAEEARAKAARARKAGASVTGAPGTGHAPNGKSPADRSLRDELGAAFDAQAGGRI